MQENKYQLVFDETMDGPQLKAYVGQCSKLNPPIVEMEENGSESDSAEGRDE